MSAKISIIIPVYKAEMYLSHCLESVIAQTYSNWELILVDDGSPDKCGEICDDYAANDSRIKVLHKRNEGVGMARNAGIEIAKGEKLCFIDADDTVEPNYLEILSSHPESDMVVCGYFVDRYDSEGTLTSSEFYSPKELLIRDRQERHLLEEAFMSGVMHINCNKLFDLSIIREHNIRYNSYLVNEDFIFIMEYLLNSESIYFVPQPLYHWIRIDGILSGVESIPTNILQIYEHSHSLLDAYLRNDKLAARIAYRSYELIIFKYLQQYKIGNISKKDCFLSLSSFHKSELVNQAFDSYTPTAPFEKVLYCLNKKGLFRITYAFMQLLSFLK